MVSLWRQLHPLKVNSRTNVVYLQLSAPHDNIIITPPRLSDAAAATEIHNDVRVYKTLVGPPFPYLPEHADSWLTSVKQASDDILDVLKQATAEDQQPEDEIDIRSELVYVDGCPVRSLREVQADGTDVFIGEIGISRCCRFEYLRNKEQEQELIERNAALPTGSPEIIWDIGDYLAPSHHGKGIMSAALRTIIREWAIPRMNAHVIHGTAFSGNTGSVRVFLKNDFKLFDHVDGCVNISASKGGGTTGLHCLQWRRDV